MVDLDIYNAGVCVAIFILAFILGLRLLLKGLGKSGHERLTALLGSFMAFCFAYAYFVWGLRVLVLPWNATVAAIFPYFIEFGLALGLGGFFELLWSIRATYFDYVAKRKWLYLFPLIGTVAFLALFGYCVFYAATPIYYGFVRDLAPDMSSVFGLAFIGVAAIDAIFYMGIIPLVVFFRKRKGKLLAGRTFLPWLGILVLFLGVLLDFALRLLPAAMLPEIGLVGVRVFIALAFFGMWFM